MDEGTAKVVTTVLCFGFAIVGFAYATPEQMAKEPWIFRLAYALMIFRAILFIATTFFGVKL